ncbi:MAG: MBL fold metallo-hydrolase [Alphaproteobacteria bacterium]|nr:MBL fold metallo-hydrolase [Alphaproteobacteria bacterium]
MIRWVWGLIAASLLMAVGVIFVQRSSIALSLYQRGVERNLAQPSMDDLGEGLHAAFCGTGSPIADRRRAGPCFAAIADGRLFVFDVGEGAQETLGIMGLPPARVEAVFLTHFHSDHIDGLGALALQHWAAGAAQAPLQVYGTTGVERIANGFNEAYAIDSGYRMAHHGNDVVPPSGFGIAAHPFELPAPDESAVVYDRDGVRILAFRVSHAPVSEAVGYRIEYQGRSVVVTGDTKKCACVSRAAENADLLASEALQPTMTRILGRAATQNNQTNIAQIMHDIEDYHVTPRQAAEMAQDANVQALALTHLIPPMPLPFLTGPFLGDAREAFNGDIWVMRDGDIVSIAPDGTMTRRNTLRF